MFTKNTKPTEAVLGTAFINVNFKALAKTTIAFAIAVIVPALLAHTPQNQFIVGPIVNAVLFWTAWRIGIGNALFVATIPSLIAFTRGMLPPQAATLIPFIILGNWAMILTFAGTRHWRFALRILLAALAKSFAIALPAVFILNLPQSVSFMMSWPQLVTALAGGLVVIGVDKLKRSK